jgi:hypothetical protein
LKSEAVVSASPRESDGAASGMQQATALPAGGGQHAGADCIVEVSISIDALEHARYIDACQCRSQQAIFKFLDAWS